MENRFKTITLKEVEQYNQEYYNGEYMGSEARPYNLDMMQFFINKIRPYYNYTEDYTNGNWKAIDIKTDHSKYGTNYIYIDEDRKLWRTTQSVTEFYGNNPVD